MLALTAVPASTPPVILWVAIILSLAGGGAGLAALLRTNSQKKLDEAQADRTDAEAGQVAATAGQIEEETRKNFLEMIREGTEDLRNQLKAAREENAEQRTKIAELELEIEKLERRLDADHMNREMQSLRLKLEASERDRVFWRNRAETLQLMLDETIRNGGEAPPERRSHEADPDEIEVDRRIPPSQRDNNHLPEIGPGIDEDALPPVVAPDTPDSLDSLGEGRERS